MKTIVWDVDDVLNDFMKVWFEDFWRANNPKCFIDFSDLNENPPCKILGISIESYRQSLDEFRSIKGYSLTPVPEILAWFNKNGHNYRHIVLTAVPINYSAISAAWVFKHFGKWIRSFNIVPSQRLTDPNFDYDRSKKDFLQWIKKGDILIEDNIKNILDARETGIKTITIGRPWNGVKTDWDYSLSLIDTLNE